MDIKVTVPAKNILDKKCKLSLAIPRKLIIEEQFFHAKSFSWQIVEWATHQSQQGRWNQGGRKQPQLVIW